MTGVAPEPPASEVASLPVPPAPAHLSAFAKDEWNRLAPELVKKGLLRNLDGTAFENRCELYSTWRSCKAFVDKHGLTYELNGLHRQRPEVRIMQDASKQMRLFDNEFGLTPAARARVKHVTGESAHPNLPLPPPQQPKAPPPAPPSTPPEEPSRMLEPAELLKHMSDDDYFRGPKH